MNNKMISGIGNISINRCSGTDGYVCRIEINDGSSSCRIIEMELSFEALGQAITGLSFQPVKFNLYGSDHIGKKHEYKTELVKIQRDIIGWKPDEDSLAKLSEALKPYEVDGWKARIDDAFNHHLTRLTDDGCVEVTMGFDRWVEK